MLHDIKLLLFEIQLLLMTILPMSAVKNFCYYVKSMAVSRFPLADTMTTNMFIACITVKGFWCFTPYFLLLSCWFKIKHFGNKRGVNKDLYK